MPSPLEQYHLGTSDWRKILRQNSQRTYIVIGLFFLTYVAIGLLIDGYLISQAQPQANLGQIYWAIFQGHLFPTATIVMLCIASLSLLISYALHDRLMLLGTHYEEITPENMDTPAKQQLYHVVEEMKVAASLRYMPKV